MKDGMKGEGTHLKVFSLAIAIGLATGIWMLLLGWAGWLFNYGHGVIVMVEPLYRGFAPTFLGGIFGGIWGFIDGFLFGAVVAFLYNCCLCCPICRDDRKPKQKYKG